MRLHTVPTSTSEGPTNIRPGRPGQAKKYCRASVSFLQKARRALAFKRLAILQTKLISI